VPAPAPPPPRLATRWISDAGGLRYHLTALRERDRAWRPFRQAVADWLAAWQPAARRLLLVGPSAGHTLPADWFARFDTVTAFEPDPIARWWLSRRLSGVPLHFDGRDVLAGPLPLADLAKARDDTAILFCNVLGQVRPAGGGSWHPVLRNVLAGRRWASYHDVVSTAQPPRPDAPEALQAGGDLESVLARFWRGGELALVDHETFRLDGQRAADYALWRLRPGQTHLVEWVAHPGADQSTGAAG